MENFNDNVNIALLTFLFDMKNTIEADGMVATVEEVINRLQEKV